MKKRKMLGLFLALTVAVGVFAGCGGESGNAGGDAANDSGSVDSSLQAVLDSGTLRVGMCPEYPPFESIDGANQIVGFDPALAAAIAEEMGINVECVNTPWEGLIAGVEKGDFDVIMSAMSPEEATAATKAVALSENYYTIGDIIVVRADEDRIASKGDLAGKTIGYQTGSTAAQAAEKLEENGVEGVVLNPYNRTADAYAELKNGRIDAVIVGKSYAVTEAKEDAEVKVIDDPLNAVGCAIVAKNGADALIQAMEEALEKVKESGLYEEIEKEFLAGE